MRRISPDINYSPLVVILGLIFASLSNLWKKRINTTVKEPYLDEYFHVRQAQLYCAGNFSYWDPKITTPPGLYGISYLWHRAGRACDISTLRSTNTDLLAIGVLLPAFLLLIARNFAKGKAGTSLINFTVDRGVARALHGAVNVCLFPPLFFFSGLYYTDIASTACVLWFLQFRESDFLSTRYVVRSVILGLVGLVALCFRQTNIFWVAIFPAALDLVSTLKTVAAASRASTDDVLRSYQQIFSQAWESGAIHDPPSDAAYFEDYVKLSITIAVAAFRRPFVALRTLLPYLFLMIAFGIFIVVNGGVVLGDKGNHVATLHTPQMLYLWPYIFFFSWQLIIPRVRALISPVHYLPEVFKRFKPMPGTKTSPRPLPVIVFLALALAAVRYNTIVHPFTLADNRHYVFYVFRILLRHPSFKYLATPVYLFCAWAALLALGLPKDVAVSKTNGQGEDKNDKVDAFSKDDTPLYTSARGSQTSYVLIWLISTTLCLITAPLVEPRYTIIPWITWRLGVASLPTTEASSPPKTQHAPNEATKWIQYILRTLNHGEHRLYVETLWFVLVNAVTGYVFLCKGFAWPQDPGVVQRFMW